MKIHTRFAPGRMLAAALSLILGATTAAAQDVIHEFAGLSNRDWFGHSVGGAGDVDGDGHDDVIVGAPLDDVGALQDAGRAIVYSGRTGAVLYTFAGTQAGERLGWAVDGAGDVDGDGRDDLIVSSYSTSVTNTVRVLSGLTGSVIYSFNGAAVDWFGFAVSGAGDVDQDGLADVLIGVPNASGGRGLVQVRASSLSGFPIHIVQGLNAFDRFGYAVSGGGDAIGDLVPDFVVGAPQIGSASEEGYISLFSGFTGVRIATKPGGVAGGRFGTAVCLERDVDGDGRADYVGGGYLTTVNGSSGMGRVRVYSGPTGQLVHELVGSVPNGWLGRSVGVADVNADGYADVLVGIPGMDVMGQDSGSIAVYCGRTGQRLFIRHGASADDMLGYSIAGAGRVTRNAGPGNDAREEFVTGAPGINEIGSPGHAYVYSLGYLLGYLFCNSNPNSTGQQAYLWANGTPLVGDNQVVFWGPLAPPNRFGYLLTSHSTGFIPLFGGSQGDLCLGSPQIRFAHHLLSSGPNGQFGYDLDLTALPQGTVIHPGETWYFQIWYRDVNPLPTSNTTSGLAITFL